MSDEKTHEEQLDEAFERVKDAKFKARACQTQVNEAQEMLADAQQASRLANEERTKALAEFNKLLAAAP